MFIIRPCEFVGPKQGNACRLKSTELRCGHIRFRIPEYVHDADGRRSLPGKVVQLKQMITSEPRRSQIRLNLLLFLNHLEFPRSHRELMCLINQVALAHELAE